MYLIGSKKRRVAVLVGMLIFCIATLLSTQAVAAQKGKITIVSRASMGMKGCDPHTNGGSSGMPVVSLLYDGLVHMGNNGKLGPALATSWAIDPGWKYITFTITDKAVWGDGKPVTPEDVKFSIERAMIPALKFVWGGELRRNVANVEIKNKNIVRVNLKKPYPAFMDRAAKELVIVPKHYVQKVGDEEFAKHPMGAGPFSFVELQQDNYLKVVAKKHHYRKTPSIKEVTLMYIQEKSTRLAKLQAGEADIVTLAPEHIKIIGDDPKFKITWSKYCNLRTLMFCALAEPDKPNPLLDIRVRQAIAYAVDTKTICKKLFHGMAEPWGNIVAPYEPGYDPSLKPHPYDLKKAKELMVKAGYAKGFKTSMYATPVFKLDAQALQSSLSKIGIKVDLQIIEHGIWRKLLKSKKLKSLGSSPTPFWNGRMHPGTALKSTFSPKSAYTYLTDDELDKAWIKLNLMTDDKEMAKQVKTLTQLYYKKLLRMNLWAVHTAFGLSKIVKYYENPPGRLYPINFEYVELKN